MQATLSPQEQIELLKRAGIKPPASAIASARVSKLNVIDFGEKYYYIPETQRPIVWEPWQRIILKIITGIHNYPTLQPFYSTILITSIKKTGKTAITGVIGRHRAESQVSRDEILFFANDETQSRGRAYAGIQTSIELDPHFDNKRRVLLDANGNEVWRIIADHLEHVPTGTKVKAVNVDYRGEAGANPSLTIWTEAWGFDTEKQFLLYQEMTPVLTRSRSQRIVESYAGYIGKSKILESIWNNAEKEGRRLTLDDIPDWPWPNEYELPLYVNDNSGLFAYIDQGPRARTRMPWTQGPEAEQYYIEQANQPGMTPEQFDRLHYNYWVSPVSAFLPVEWWVACRDSSIEPIKPMREPINILTIPELDEEIEVNGVMVKAIDEYIRSSNWRNTGYDSPPLVIASDASVSGDCTGVTGCTRHPANYQNVALRMAVKWDPPRGSKLDYEYTPSSKTGLSLKQTLIDWCLRYNLVEIAYDEWQLHHLMNEIRNMGMAWCKPFSQATARDVADKQLYDIIKTRRIGYNELDPNIDHEAVQSHIKNAARKQRANEDTKLHIIKSGEGAKIDLVICLSMASAECLRLDL